MPWSSPLTPAITLKDGRTLSTLREAANLLLALSEARQSHEWVKYAAELLMKAAESGAEEDIEDATFQVERALMREGML